MNQFLFFQLSEYSLYLFYLDSPQKHLIQMFGYAMDDGY